MCFWEEAAPSFSFISPQRYIKSYILCDSCLWALLETCLWRYLKHKISHILPINSHFTPTITINSFIHTFKNHSYCETSVGEIRYSLAKLLFEQCTLYIVQYCRWCSNNSIRLGFYAAETWRHLMTSSFAAGLFGVEIRCCHRSLPLPTSVKLISWLFQVEPIEGTNAVVEVLDRRNQTSQIRNNYNKQLCRFLLL